jgi:hypothetical protein
MASDELVDGIEGLSERLEESSSFGIGDRLYKMKQCVAAVALSTFWVALLMF